MPAPISPGVLPLEVGSQSSSYPSHALWRIDASIPVSPCAVASAQCVSPRHSRMQLMACHPDRVGSEGRSMRRCEAKNVRPLVGSCSTIVHQMSASRARTGRRSGEWAASPSSTASLRAFQTSSNDVDASTIANVARIASGLMDPKAAMTASGPAGARGAHRAAMYPIGPGSPSVAKRPTAPGSQKIHPMVVCTERELRFAVADQSIDTPDIVNGRAANLRRQ